MRVWFINQLIYNNGHKLFNRTGNVEPSDEDASCMFFYNLQKGKLRVFFEDNIIL